MPNVSINLTGETVMPSGRVLTIPNEEPFISVDFTQHVTVMLPGFGAAAVTAARAMAAKFHELADECERRITANR